MKAGITIIVLVMSGAAEARMTAAEKKACIEYYDQRIETVNKRLKQGYKEPTGNRLRKERREYQDAKSRQCR